MGEKNKVAEQKVAISRKRIGGEIPIIVNEITDGCLYTGFFGILDSARMKAITDKVLEIVASTDNDIMIIDLSNIDIIDSAVASHLLRLGDTASLVGMNTIFCGISPTVAQVMVTTGIEMKGSKIVKNLKSAIKLVFSLQNLELVQKVSKID